MWLRTHIKSISLCVCCTRYTVGQSEERFEPTATESRINESTVPKEPARSVTLFKIQVSSDWSSTAHAPSLPAAGDGGRYSATDVESHQ